jgi:hypothetical protein
MPSPRRFPPPWSIEDLASRSMKTVRRKQAGDGLIRMAPVYLVFLIFVAALPVVHIFTGAAIPFGNDGHCDPWYYFGLMEFPELGHVLAPGLRAISRLPAYVPISLWHEIGATATGQQLYFWFNHIVFTVATALALAVLFEIRIALVVTTLLTTSALYLEVLSTTYTTGAALAYGSVALACVSIGLRRPILMMPLSFIAGVFVAFALHSHLVSAVFIFFLPILYAPSGARAFVTGAALMITGIIAGTGLVGLTGLYLGDGFWSFENQIRQTISGMGDFWYEGWMTRSIGLLLMVFLPALQTITWARKRNSKRSLAILASAIAVSAVNLIVTFAHKDQHLVFSYLYVMTIPIAALVFADAIEDYIVHLGPVACGMILAFLAISHVAIVAYLRGYVLLYFMPIALAGAVLALGLSLIYERLRSAACGMAIIGSLFIFMQGTLGYFRAHLDSDRAAARWNTQQVDKALRFMRSYGITEKPVVWLGKVDNEAIELGTFRSLVRCGFSTNFPDQPPDGDLQWQPPIAAGRLLIIIDNPKNYPDVKDALAKKGISIENAKSENINDSFRITIGRVVASASNTNAGDSAGAKKSN